MSSNTAPPCLICAYPSTSRCAGCRQASYCSKEHQKIAWPKHKKLCKIYQADSAPSPETYCGLCGSAGPLTKTECCDRTVCDDQASYQPFSYSNVSCLRNHKRYTICAFHFTESHGEGDWKECTKCMASFRGEDLVAKGTSSFNFREDEWKEAPNFEKNVCVGCGKQVKTACEPYALVPGGVQCTKCLGGMDFGGVGAMDS